MEFFRRLFDSDFLPHGHCFNWQPQLVWLYVISDSLIGLAYYSIPLTLLYFVRGWQRARLRGLTWMFGAFILACGTTHFLAVWDLWHSTYRLEGLMKAVTAALSVVTAAVLVKVTPMARKIPSPEELTGVNDQLRAEIERRSAAEAELKALLSQERAAGEAKLRVYLEGTVQAIISVRPDLTIQTVNRAAEELFGYDRSELVGNKLEMLWPERYREQYPALHRAYFDTPDLRRGATVVERVYRRKNGEEFFGEKSLSYINIEDGPLEFGIITDITARRRAEAQLAHAVEESRASEAKLRSYFESASQGILGVSKEGRIVMLNRRMEELFGYAREEMLGQRLEFLLPERLWERHVVHRQGFFREPRTRAMGAGFDLAARRKDGTEFPVEIGLSFVEDGQLSVGLVSDITERKQAADRMTKLNQELLRSNAELEQFAYVASHDLQEPLRMVTGYLTILERRYKANLDAEAREFIEYAVDGAKRMKGLIRDFLSVSRISTQQLRFQTVSGDAILKDAIANLTMAITESGAEIVAGPLPRFLGDGGLLAQVFQNLIANAIKFRGESPPRIEITAILESTAWVFSFRDNGIGIPPQHAERIFRIFERLNDADKYAGNGIGLAICQKIVERHGGRIWAEGEGRGAVFRFSIPLSSEMNHAANS